MVPVRRANDFLIKPIRYEELVATLYLPSRRSVVSSNIETPKIPNVAPNVAPDANALTPILDAQGIAALTRLAKGKTPMFNKLISVYLKALREITASFEDVNLADDMEQARQLSHRLAGSSANYGAGRLTVLAKRLEELAMSGDVPAASKVLDALLLAAVETDKEMCALMIAPASDDAEPEKA